VLTPVVVLVVEPVDRPVVPDRVPVLRLVLPVADVVPVGEVTAPALVPIEPEPIMPMALVPPVVPVALVVAPAEPAGFESVRPLLPLIPALAPAVEPVLPIEPEGERIRLPAVVPLDIPVPPV
jgi:hypothetical protein